MAMARPEYLELQKTDGVTVDGIIENW